MATALEEFDSKTYSSVHAAFGQALISYGIITSRQCFDILADVMDTFGYKLDKRDKVLIRELAKNIIVCINARFRPLGVECRRCMDEDTGAHYYALLHRLETPETVASYRGYTVQQMEFFKIMLSEIFAEDNEERSLSITDCLNLMPKSPSQMTLMDAENFVNDLIERRWLHKTRGILKLAVRGIFELEPYLKDTYNLSNCCICEFIVAVAKEQRCQECGKFVHAVCMRKRKANKCPSCKTAWPYELSEEIPCSQMTQMTTASQMTAGSSRRKLKAENSADQDDISIASQQTRKSR